MRWKIPLAVLVLSLGLCATVRAETTFFEKLGEIKRQIDTNEPKQAWKKIKWAADMDAAQKQAARENKPILVFMFVNEKGQKDAEHC